jgi:hypothetical protein
MLPYFVSYPKHNKQPTWSHIYIIISQYITLLYNGGCVDHSIHFVTPVTHLYQCIPLCYTGVTTHSVYRLFLHCSPNHSTFPALTITRWSRHPLYFALDLDLFLIEVYHNPLEPIMLYTTINNTLLLSS